MSCLSKQSRHFLTFSTHIWQGIRQNFMQMTENQCVKNFALSYRFTYMYEIQIFIQCRFYLSTNYLHIKKTFVKCNPLMAMGLCMMKRNMKSRLQCTCHMLSVIIIVQLPIILEFLLVLLLVEIVGYSIMLQVANLVNPLQVMF